MTMGHPLSPLFFIVGIHDTLLKIEETLNE